MTAWELLRHPGELALVQLPAHAAVPRWALAEEHDAPLWCVARTSEELSLICSYEALPGSVSGSGPYVAFSVNGPLEHSLVGVLAGLLPPLSDAGIPVMAQSTFDTDWILVPAMHADAATAVWTIAGHAVEALEEEE